MEACGARVARGDTSSARRAVRASVVALVRPARALFARLKAIRGILARYALPFSNNWEREKMQLIC